MAKKTANIDETYKLAGETLPGEEINNEPSDEEPLETSSQSSKRSCPLVIAFPNGVEKNFGIRGQVLSEETVDLETLSINIDVYFSNGQQLNYKADLQEVTEFKLKVLAEGFISKAKATTAGCNVEEAFVAVQKKFVEEYPNEVFVQRTSGESSTQLTQLELAWAYMEKIDPQTPEGYTRVQEFFRDMSRQERKDLKASRPIRLAYLQMETEKLLAEV